MKKNELKKMDTKTLLEKVDALKKELFDLRLSAASTPIKDNSQFKKLRVTIAQVLTYVNEKTKSLETQNKSVE